MLQESGHRACFGVIEKVYRRCDRESQPSSSTSSSVFDVPCIQAVVQGAAMNGIEMAAIWQIYFGNRADDATKLTSLIVPCRFVDSRSSIRVRMKKLNFSQQPVFPTTFSRVWGARLSITIADALFAIVKLDVRPGRAGYGYTRVGRLLTIIPARKNAKQRHRYCN